MEQQTQQQADWARQTPGAGISVMSSLSITVSRGKRGGWVVWDAADADAPTAYCTTLAEAWAIATDMALDLGRPHNELPWRPQPPQIAYQPQRMPQPQPQAYPPPQDTFPNVVERERSLSEQIATVQRGNNGKIANSIAAVFLLAVVALHAWPFGA